MTHIFIEAKDKNTSEANFLKAFIEEKIRPKILNLNYKIMYVDGKDKSFNDTLFSDTITKLKISSISEDKILIIFDADSKDNLGGFEKRKKEILDKKEEHNKANKNEKIEFELFLFPNNKDNGMFEDLLDSIIPDKHKPMLDCFYGYEACLDKSGYHSPDIKTKVYAYIASQNITKGQRKKLGSGEWLFENKEYWDLDSDKLDALKKFLIDNI